MDIPSEEGVLLKDDEDKEDSKADMEISSGMEDSSKNNHNDTKSDTEEEKDFYLPPYRTAQQRGCTIHNQI